MAVRCGAVVRRRAAGYVERVARALKARGSAASTDTDEEIGLIMGKYLAEELLVG
jgi:hypothetical protein